MTKTEYKKIINDHIEKEFDIIFELIATDTATIDSVTEQLTDEIAATTPVDTDKDRDTLTAAVYEVLKIDHAAELERGEKIKNLMLVITNNPAAFNEYNNNIWTLAEHLTEATPETLATYEKKYLNK